MPTLRCMQAFTRLLGLRLVDPSTVDSSSLFNATFPAYNPPLSTIQVQRGRVHALHSLLKAELFGRAPESYGSWPLRCKRKELTFTAVRTRIPTWDILPSSSACEAPCVRKETMKLSCPPPTFLLRPSSLHRHAAAFIGGPLTLSWYALSVCFGG